MRTVNRLKAYAGPYWNYQTSDELEAKIEADARAERRQIFNLGLVWGAVIGVSLSAIFVAIAGKL